MRTSRTDGHEGVGPRTVLTAEQVNAIAEKLKEPYATLVLFLAATGLRIGEALALKGTDFKNNVLHVTRRIYDGDVEPVKSKRSERKLPIDPLLMARMEKLGKGEWVFRSKTGTPLNQGNALKRHVRPAAEKLGISLGGWHDFRHTLSTKLRRSGGSSESRIRYSGPQERSTSRWMSTTGRRSKTSCSRSRSYSAFWFQSDTK
ncbi:MAG: hypothetical protein DMG63_10730 [Acidobacteria bacterium]|nr:MAG: hypothetical protein DMG63_10730 [Acidobacteriota bacterium]